MYKEDYRAYYLRELGVCPPLAKMYTSLNIEPLAGARFAISSNEQQHIPDLDSIATEVSHCTECKLAVGRTQTVFGVGNPHARLLIVGEAPGREEDLRGEPFVGRAGKLLDRMLMAMGLDRSQVYIMNVVKCRPPENRNPEQSEIRACSHWFYSQWSAISPQVVCLLGRVAAQAVLGSEAPMSALRGRWHVIRGARVRATYHPAFLLRSPQQKVHVWHDLQSVMLALREA